MAITITEFDIVRAMEGGQICLGDLLANLFDAPEKFQADIINSAAATLTAGGMADDVDTFCTTLLRKIEVLET